MIRTERLALRPWRDGDAAAHNALASHPRVAEMLGKVPTLADSHDTVRRQRLLQAEHGHCFWVVEHAGSFSGWCGLKPGALPIEGELEIGWTLAPDLWGRGLAREAAAATLDWVWATTDRPHVAAITATGNARSRALMARLGMTHVPAGDFDHPDLAEGHPLRRHVLYRIGRPA